MSLSPLRGRTSRGSIARMDLHTEFEDWRRRRDQGWGLAWYLAAEVMERFYASHGIAAVEIEKEGLGY